MNLSREKIIEYSKRYDAGFKGTPDELIEKKLKIWFRDHRYLDRQNFIKLGLWKSARQEKNYKSKENDNITVKEITGFALSTKSEKARIESLMVLKGVSWSVASVILHFAFPDEYPILDFRAIESLGWEQPKDYDFQFWQKYVSELRKLAKKYNVSLRELDKALWSYSKESLKNPSRQLRS
ncbi:hypothetical protein LCGC14_2940710 [marine sediment metagenome]|uniref:HhH-GPD domain-containing protein n=1 Tax=marine sediment metagenome TaxID=412755 RepID=A0A0F9A966_9ZZZZ